MAQNRFVNKTVSELQKCNRNPIFDYEDSPLLTLEQTVEKIIPPIPRITDYVATATMNSDRHSSSLTQDESAAIYLYSMPVPFFSTLNNTLRGVNRDTLKSWFAFLKLLITALEKLLSTKATVWRGVNYDDTLTFVDNDVHVWWSINSCSMNPNSVHPYLGESGTLFAIDATHAKDISALSAIPDEHEVVLMPGTRVRRRYESLNFIDRLFVIHLEEISSQSESQSQSNYLFETIKQTYRQNNRIERIMNPAKSFPIDQSYINLAIVTTKEQQEKEKQLCQQQHAHVIMGSFEQIYGMKTAMDVKDIFKSCKNPQQQVLVFGRAGIGKSTFCRYIAYQWARNSYWPQYELLALIPLRRLTTNRYPLLPPGQNYSLIDLVKKELFSYDLTEKEENLFRNQFDVKKTLWILDGYDEIIQSVPPHLEYLLEQLLKTPHHILTSRPYLITLSYDVQMEITGFTDENIEEYVQRFFEQMKDELDDASIKSQTLLKFLRSNPSIWGVAHIPVNLELISSLWCNEDWSDTNELTITTLYTMMTEWLCRRYLASQNNHIQRLFEDEVYQRCQKELTFLESLAFNAIESNTIIIRPSLLKKALAEAKVSLQEHPHILNVGILKTFTKQGIGIQIETKKDHYFIHLSFQEYFAARYLINALKGSSSGKAIEFIKYQKYNQRYALVFTFMSGLLGDNDHNVCSNIFWNTILKEAVDIVGIRHMQLVISCLEATSDKSTVPQYTELIQWIAKCIQHNVSTENRTILNYISKLLQTAQSVVCDQTIINMLISLLRYDDPAGKENILLFISWLHISNPSIDLITSITVCLNDKNDQVISNAFYALGEMGEKAATNEVIGKLLSGLGDDSDRVRSSACYVFGTMGEKTATNEVIDKLLSALEHDSDRVRSSACYVLETIGEKAATNEIINKLLSALEDGNNFVRSRACDALGKISEKAATNDILHKLMSVLRDDSDDVRSCASCALAKIGEKVATNEVINELMSALEDDSDHVRSSACYVLGKMGEKAATNEVINKLLDALGDDSHRVRSRASYALAKIGEKAATNKVIDKLLNALEDDNDGARSRACYVLGEMGEKAATDEVINKLLSALKDDSDRVRSDAFDALGKMGEKAATKEVINQLLGALEDDSDCVRLDAFDTLGEMGEKAATKEVINKLLSVLGDDTDRFKSEACYVLGKMGEKAATNEVINQLLSALEDENGLVRSRVCDALGKIGEKVATNEVINKLISTLGDDSSDVRSEVCYALGRMGEKAATNEVINKLMNALEDDSGLVTRAACRALGNLGDKAATEEIINKMMVLVNRIYDLVSSGVSDVISKILSSSDRILQVGPKVISNLCITGWASCCITNISGDQLIYMFLTTKDPEWLSAGKKVLLLQESAVIVTLDKVIVYGRKEPVELRIPNLELRQQLIDALNNQAKELILSFDIRPEVSNKS